MPAHGFYIRHVKNIEMHDIEVKPMKQDLRPGLLLEDVQGADFTHIKVAQATEVPTFVLKNVENFRVHNSKPLPDTQFEKADQKQL